MVVFQEELDRLITLLDEFKVYAIYFFGSMAANKMRKDSNIDIAFLTDEDISDYEVLMKSGKLYDVFQRDCNLVNLKKSSAELKMQVIGKGKVVYCVDNLKKSSFEMKCFKEYYLLKDKDCQVLHSVSEEGNRYIDKDIFYNKIANIERFINRIVKVYDNDVINLKYDIKQESILLNFLRASKSSMDLALYIAAENKLGIPQTSIDGFEILKTNNILQEDLAEKMKSLISFRNIILHDYEKISIILIQEMIEKNLYDFHKYIDSLKRYVNEMGENN